MSDMWANMDNQESSSNSEDGEAPSPFRTMPSNPVAQQMYQPSRRRAHVICELCNNRVMHHIYYPCGHTFCWPCISAYQAAPPSPDDNCPTCYYNQPLQLVSADSTGRLQLEESAVQRCFLERDDWPVYVISVVGERRTGKSFLMNYLMRVLHSLEENRVPNLGGRNEPLSGFPWWRGTDKVTEGIWIWGKPFILENNGNKMAIFLLDTEGKNASCHEIDSIKLFVLTMMISSHLVYNVNANIKETDIDYLEIYCDPLENDPFHLFFALKHFDVLVRDRQDVEDCRADLGKSYIEEQIQRLGRRDMRSVLNLVYQRQIQCFLMPHPDSAMAEDKWARLRDMDEDFQKGLRTYLMDVAQRTQNCSSVMTCRKMAAKLQVCVEYVRNARYFSSPLELCNLLKAQAERNTEREMDRMKMEFQNFLREQTQWRLPSQMSNLVTQKVTEVIKKFQEQALLSRDEHHQCLVMTLLDQLMEEGDNFCATHKDNLKYNGLKAAIQVGLTAVAAMPFLLVAPAAAPAGGLLSTVGGWFSSAPAAATVSGYAASTATAGMAMLQAGAGFVRRFW